MEQKSVISQGFPSSTVVRRCRPGNDFDKFYFSRPGCWHLYVYTIKYIRKFGRQLLMLLDIRDLRTTVQMVINLFYTNLYWYRLYGSSLMYNTIKCVPLVLKRELYYNKRCARVSLENIRTKLCTFNIPQSKMNVKRAFQMRPWFAKKMVIFILFWNYSPLFWKWPQRAWKYITFISASIFWKVAFEYYFLWRKHRNRTTSTYQSFRFFIQSITQMVRTALSTAQTKSYNKFLQYESYRGCLLLSYEN